MHKGSFLWGNHIQKWCAAGPSEICALREMPPKIEKEIFALIFRHNELPQQVLLSACRNMCTTEKTHISESRLDMEQDI